jgi:glucose-6-phosphate isomerase
MSKFTSYRTYNRLQELALEPLDFQQDTITPRRLETYLSKACGWTLSFATQRLNEVTLLAFQELAEEAGALEQMLVMQAGGVVNRIQGVASENRPALHTAMRDFFESRQTSQAAKEAAECAWGELEKLKSFLEEVADRFDTVVQIGIGGSELGPKAVYEALKVYQKKGREVHFVANVDPDEAAYVIKHVDLQKTLIVSVSKSGSTLETQTNELAIRQAYEELGIDPKKHFVAVTCPSSMMDNLEKYSKVFYMWDYVGGRYSVCSMVGAISLAFAFGMDRFLEFLRGASCMDKVACLPEVKKNLPLLAALIGIWNRNFLSHPALAIIPYSRALSRFSAHLQQLDMESNGKSCTKLGTKVEFETGPLIWGEVGTNSQHSFFQFLHQGTDVVPIDFIGFKQPQYGHDIVCDGTSSQDKLLANMYAQMLSLAQGQKDENFNKNFSGNRPSSLLIAEKLDPFHLGALLAFYEHKVAFQGFIWGINSFDQEGVQLGKRLSNSILEAFKSHGESGHPLGKTLLKIF